MKKVLIILAVVALVCVGFASCKSTHDCPAYGNSQTNSLEKRV